MADAIGAVLALVGSDDPAVVLDEPPCEIRGRPLAGVQRWVSTDRPGLCALFADVSGWADLEDVCRAHQADELQFRWTSRTTPIPARADVYVAEQRDPGGMLTPEGAAAFYVVLTNVAEHAAEDFDRWFAEEHQPALAQVPGVISARHYQTRSGPHRRFAAFHLADPGIVFSDAWHRAAASPWTDRIRSSMQETERIVFSTPAR